MNRRVRTLVHASNITGLGAAGVVRSLLPALAEYLSNDDEVCVPDGPLLGDLSGIGEKTQLRRYRRLLPYAVSRVVECLFAPLLHPRSERVLVLGDIPLNRLPNQVVLVHQPHMVPRSVNPYSSNGLDLLFTRWLFRRHMRYVRAWLVQTDVMRDQLTAAYPEIAGRVHVIPQPAPSGFLDEVSSPPHAARAGLRLFYPASPYPHKNHKLIRAMLVHPPEALADTAFRVTVEDPASLSEPGWQPLGRIDYPACQQEYAAADALFFPSLQESYGLPLVEAMLAGLPIIAADRPYARWMCEGQAILFDPESPSDAWRAVGEAQSAIRAGRWPDWSGPLAKLPDSWQAVAAEYMRILTDSPPHSV